jgi:microcystin-dependent protein
VAQPYVGEIRIFAGNFAPTGWMFCDGSLLSISENETLFQLIGTTYGGDGQSTFALPDLRSRIPIHQGNGTQGNTYIIGQTGGQEEVTLTLNQLPAHRHVPAAQTGRGNSNKPGNAVWASSILKQYSETPSGSMLADNIVSYTGGNQAHSNIMPFLGINFIISLFGIFPSQT